MLRNAVVQRAGKPLLSIDDFSLARGEHVALLGPNGAGKSTFVKLITREVLPLHLDEPPLRFMGNERATLAEVKQLVGVVSASMQQQIRAHLPVIEVVMGGLHGTLGLPRHIDSKSQDELRAHEVLALVGVDDLADRDAMTLSTGQARRVLIARALVHRPVALVLDEPCTGLDPEGQHSVRSSMRTLAQKGISLVLVTHYPEDLIPEIKRVVLLKSGRVCADGPKERLITSEMMSKLFGVELRVSRSGTHGDYYALVDEY